MEYRVTWEIDIEAETPREASERAFSLVRGIDTIATVFYCTPADGHKSTRVDLLETE